MKKFLKNILEEVPMIIFALIVFILLFDMVLMVFFHKSFIFAREWNNELEYIQEATTYANPKVENISDEEEIEESVNDDDKYTEKKSSKSHKSSNSSRSTKKLVPYYNPATKTVMIGIR